MSEYQYFAFRALDGPLTDKGLEFARSQSTRAEITRWSFENEYHFGDYGGDAKEMLRKGFDVHLHYANFGVRTIMTRLPRGLPGTPSVRKQYVGGGPVVWEKDNRGKGGILVICPEGDTGTYESLWGPDANEYVDDVCHLRNELTDGDLRALYTLWLCGHSGDYEDVPEELVEPPVPAGLAEPSEACRSLLGFFGVDHLILDAAGESAPALTECATLDMRIEAWVKELPAKEARSLFAQILVDDTSRCRADVLVRFRARTKIPNWPTHKGTRTLAELQQRAKQLRAEADAQERAQRKTAAQQDAECQERERQQRMKLMVKQPERWLQEVDKLVGSRGTSNYRVASEILADLREAIGGDEGDKLARRHAADLAKHHPTLTLLRNSLRKRGLLS